MIPDPKPILIARLDRKPYAPILSREERAAFAAAHRILTERTFDARLACPGMFRSRMTEMIAEIIQQEWKRK